MTTNFSGINVSPRMFSGDYNYAVGVSCVFQTKDGEKGHNTHVIIRVCTQGGEVIAERRNICGHWVEKTSYLVPLDLNKSPDKSELLSGEVQIEASSAGTEHWVFDFEVLIFFKDGTTIAERFSKNALNKNVCLSWNTAETPN